MERDPDWLTPESRGYDYGREDHLADMADLDRKAEPSVITNGDDPANASARLRTLADIEHGCDEPQAESVIERTVTVKLPESAATWVTALLIQQGVQLWGKDRMRQERADNTAALEAFNRALGGGA